LSEVSMIDVVEFELGRELYAMDIQLAREIVEMMPITPHPAGAGLHRRDHEPPG